MGFADSMPSCQRVSPAPSKGHSKASPKYLAEISYSGAGVTRIALTVPKVPLPVTPGNNIIAD